jgi:prepilin-type N-terminal cleavage/methylation domain-containing protein
MIKKRNGFTLIEMIVFILISSILGSTLLVSLNSLLLKTPAIQNQQIATNLASQCMSWLQTQYRMTGYASFSCPTTLLANQSTFCPATSGKFATTVTVICTTFNSDTNYKTINVSVSGPANANLSLLIAST